MKTELSKAMKAEPPGRPTTLLLTFTLALFGAGACGAAPDEQEASAYETSETGGEVESAAAALASAPSCVGMRSGTIKRTRLPGQWTGIIDNACDRSVRVNLDIGCANPDPGCRTYAARTSHNATWWAGVASSCFRKVYECN
jgi:hypothetical protein